MVGPKIEPPDGDLLPGKFREKLWLAGLGGVLLLVVSYYVFPLSKDPPDWWPLHVGSWPPLWWLFARDATHEVGFALIVAVIIWRSFEFLAQKESAHHWNRRLEQISQGVFAAMLKRELPEKLVTQAFELILHQQLIRKEATFLFRIIDATYQDRFGDPQPYVKLHVVVSYKIKNVSDRNAELTLQIALPNPLINELKPLSDVMKFIVRAREGNDQEKDMEYPLEEARARFMEAIDDDWTTEVPFVVGKRSLAPQEERQIIVEYFMAKEVEDNEVVQMRYPTESVSITIENLGSVTRGVVAKAIHPKSLDRLSVGQFEGPGFSPWTGISCLIKAL
jgi:hypothetical protein